MNHIYNQPQFGEDWFDYQDVYSEFARDCPDNGHIIEIGSWKGKSSVFMAVEIINSNKQIKFDCIDTWLGTANDQCHKDIIKNINNKLFEVFLQNIKPVNNIITPIRKTSEEASLLYEDESVDIIFIDADHSEEAVKKDINLWLPKVKKNGILAGHDYFSWPGVQKAVNELIGNKNIKTKTSCWIHHKL